MCLSAQTHAGWMDIGKYLEAYIFGEYGLKILKRLKYFNGTVS